MTIVCNHNPKKLFDPKKDELRGRLTILYTEFLGHTGLFVLLEK
jgi:hypothetical protein